MSPLFGKKTEKKPLELPELPSLPTFPDIPRIQREEKPEMSTSMFPEIPNQQSRPLFPASTPSISEITEEPVEITKEPIFVKISKYKEALSSFEILKKKIYETTSILEKIREIKQQEEMQIEEWQKELEIIKEKLNAIDNKLFLKV
jgi:hypothetical protein